MRDELRDVTGGRIVHRAKMSVARGPETQSLAALAGRRAAKASELKTLLAPFPEEMISWVVSARQHQE